MKQYLCLIILGLVAGCSPGGPLALFRKLSPHDQYAGRLKTAGLDRTAMGTAWLLAASSSYAQALDISVPYKETGYFPATQVKAVALRFTAKRGQLIKVTSTMRPADSFSLFADLTLVQEDQKLKIIASADSTGAPFTCEIKKTATYVLRLQPELLRGGEYTLTITTGPSLEFPVAVSGNPRIESFWGDSRDNGGRQHEGIDIFAPKGTPALAAFNGTVTSVTENNLGGRVVFMRPENKDYTLYYAHLGVQLVDNGQQVLAGDTVGLIDNTGNAKTTPSHLHFGIYTGAGAIDPMPFVDRRAEQPPAIRLPLTRLNDTLKVSRSSETFEAGEPVIIQAISGSRYRVTGVHGRGSWLSGNAVSSLKPLHKTLRGSQPLYDHPDSTAARMTEIKAGSLVTVMAAYRDFELVRYGAVTGWVDKR